MCGARGSLFFLVRLLDPVIHASFSTAIHLRQGMLTRDGNTLSFLPRCIFILASNVAPALQGKEAELKRSQLEDRLNSKIQERPSPDALVEKHILGMCFFRLIFFL